MPIPAYITFVYNGEKLEGAVTFPGKEGATEAHEFGHEVKFKEQDFFTGIVVREHSPLAFIKPVDSISVILYQILCQGYFVDKVIIDWYRKDEKANKEIVYFQHILEKVKICSISMIMNNVKDPRFEQYPYLEKITVRYDRICWNIPDGNIRYTDRWQFAFLIDGMNLNENAEYEKMMGQEALTDSMTDEEEKPQETLSITNPCWEHSDDTLKSESPDKAHANDTIKLSVDVKGFVNQYKITFDIYDISGSPMRIDTVSGKNDEGKASVEWTVEDPRKPDDTKELKLVFEAHARSKYSDRKEIGFETVELTIESPVWRTPEGEDINDITHDQIVRFESKVKGAGKDSAVTFTIYEEVDGAQKKVGVASGKLEGGNAVSENWKIPNTIKGNLICAAACGRVKSEKTQITTKAPVVIDEIEVFVEKSGQQRKIGSNGNLGVVPDLVLGRKVTCKIKNGAVATWKMEGYKTEVQNGSEVNFTLRGWEKITKGIWYAGEQPKACTITATDKTGKKLSAKVGVYTGTKEVVDIEFMKLPLYKGIKNGIDTMCSFLKQLTGRELKVEYLKGKIAYNAGFEENDTDMQAFFGYDCVVGLDPLLEAKLKIPFGLNAVIPAPLNKFKDYLYFNLVLAGGMNVNAHYKRVGIQKSEPVFDSQLKILVGLEGGAHATKNNGEYVIIDAKLESNSSVTGESAGLSNENGIGLSLEIKWDGICASGSIAVFDGFFTYKKTIAFIEPKTLMSKKDFYIVHKNQS